MNSNPYLNKYPHSSPTNRALGTMDPAQHPEDIWNGRYQPRTALPSIRAGQNMDLTNDLRFEKPTYSPPTQISRGVTSTSGRSGSFTLYDATGGTKLFDYNPVTGVITITGSLVAQQVNTGTYTGITIAGQNTISGTMANGVYGTSLFQGGTVANAVIGTPSLQAGTIGTAQITGGTVGTSQITGGTINAGVYQTGGTAGFSGTIAFVRSVSPGTVLGSITVNNGLIIGTS